MVGSRYCIQICGVLENCDEYFIRVDAGEILVISVQMRAEVIYKKRDKEDLGVDENLKTSLNGSEVWAGPSATDGSCCSSDGSFLDAKGGIYA